MSTNFWELLQQHQNDLTKSGHMVADYLVQHAAEAQYLSISSLARECKVAEATVFRFCRALGFEGYHEMRIALAQANATGVLVNQQAPSPDADTTTLCEHASALFMTAINGTQNALSPEAVDQAVALLRQAKQVYCMGQGGSMVVADEICARFACVTNKFRATGDSHKMCIRDSAGGAAHIHALDALGDQVAGEGLDALHRDVALSVIAGVKGREHTLIFGDIFHGSISFFL